jgi:hypothetical protein
MAYYVIRPSRAAKIMADVMADTQAQVWVSDAYSAQMNHPAPHYQLCLAHQLRDLQSGMDAEDGDWARQMQTLFRRAIQLHRRKRLFLVFATA